jgi:hypothetical protein
MVKKVFAHLCTWFQTKEYSGKYAMWNSDYEQNPHNPEVILYNGEHDTATIGQPLIGLYDSSDPYLIEYQFQLMKLTGIDGVIVDWDGRRINPERHQMFLKILPYLEKYQLELIVCFEEWCGYYPEGTYENRQAEISAAIDELDWLEKNITSKTYYADYHGYKPILVFRKIPNQWFKPIEWKYIKETFASKKLQFYFNDCYDVKYNQVVDGWFYWVGGFNEHNVNTLPYLKNEYYNYLEQCSQNDPKKDVLMSVVPGFDDTMVWGWGDRARIAPRYNGKRYELMWEWIIKNDFDFVQIVTWNDWNEGSQIEPSTRYGYQYLEMTKNYISILKKKEIEKENVYDVCFSLYKNKISLPFSLSEKGQTEELIKIMKGLKN